MMIPLLTPVPLLLAAAAPDESCALRAVFSARGEGAALDATTPETCRHAVAELAEAIGRGLDEAPAGAPLASIAIGRLVSYPELSRRLAQQAASDPSWDGATGTGRGGDNRVVARLLAGLPEVAPLRAALAARGYALEGFAVEKVLVAESAGARLPWDAAVRLVVKPR